MGEFTPPEETTWVFTKTYDEVFKYPFVETGYFFMFVVIVYLLLVLKILPDFMKNREAFKINNIVVLHNVIQVCLSAYYVYLSLDIMLYTGLIPRKCFIDHPQVREKMAYFYYFHIWGKITELLDTIFFVLRKKYNQVSFLHVYHHASVVVGTWILLRYAISHHGLYCFFINSVVHVVMYFYYGFSALGPWTAKYLTWKRHITTFQMVQFVSMVSVTFWSLFFSACEHSIIGFIYIIPSALLFLNLFLDFFKKSYTTVKAKPKSADAGQNLIEESSKSQ